MTQINKVDTNRIKMEVVSYDAPEVKAGSKFGRFLRSSGAFLGPVGLASGFLWPFAPLVGLAAYGLGGFGGYRDSTRRQQQIAAMTPTPTLVPGVNTIAGSPSMVGGAPISQTSGDPLNIISNQVIPSRQAAQNDMIGQVKPMEVK